jgi:hypothetical protein
LMPIHQDIGANWKCQIFALVTCDLTWHPYSVMWFVHIRYAIGIRTIRFDSTGRSLVQLFEQVGGVKWGLPVRAIPVVPGENLNWKWSALWTLISSGKEKGFLWSWVCIHRGRLLIFIHFHNWSYNHNSGNSFEPSSPETSRNADIPLAEHLYGIPTTQIVPGHILETLVPQLIGPCRKLASNFRPSPPVARAAKHVCPSSDVPTPPSSAGKV